MLALKLSTHGLKKKSLDVTGSMAAFFVGFFSLASSYRFGMLLITFYYSSSKLTKLKEDKKKRLEDDYKEGGQRNYLQVLTNSVLGTLVAVTFSYVMGEDRFLDFRNNGSSIEC